ncbi:Uncharacterised protein [Vibrio cholerae]|uniref:Uncharacterized protein n=1 Tax=Vibrio cholerae TaxID=666 RepID=A0A655NSK1_VIBCL|nr:Uncharacterised protein [Vibrio cholerae]CSA31837.1 Uncharacterised protein [Vibrio cholerae]CSC92042.1 Uncharacterised protein [Vibrio cholerae]
MVSIPSTGASALVTLENNFGKKPSSAEALNTCAMVNCQPSSEPVQDTIAHAMTIAPMVGLNICAKARPKGAFELARSAFGTIPAITLVEMM